MSKEINSILKEALEMISPSDEERIYVKKKVAEFSDEIKKRIKKSNLKTDVFIGGSFAKGTMIKKETYDVDIFLRFEKGYDSISDKTADLLKGIQNKRIHGSRDYFEVKVDDSLVLEVIPVRKISKSTESENITDLSYLHVNYVKKNAKSKKILDDIKLAKAFCHANGVYGAESHIKGFSGYALELLIQNYGSFTKFLKALANEDKKLVIDKEKFFRNRNEVLMNLNASKLESPIVLVDPTYKYRNVLAALKQETFSKFQKVCKDFLKKPSLSFFVKKETDFDKIRQQASKKNLEFVIVKVETKKQEGSIAGSKLLKFCKHLSGEIARHFDINMTGFEYYNKNTALCYFAVKGKGEIVIQGPDLIDETGVKKFKKAHKNTFSKSGRIYAREKTEKSLKSFLDKWRDKNSIKAEDMSVSNIEISS